MVRVLLFGASGFVGSPIAAALRRRGHIVYAVVRTESKAIELSKQELIPILGDASQPETWTPVLDRIDVVIDSSPSFGGISEKILDGIKESPRVKNARKIDPKIGLIYVSGIWVHGSSPDVATDRVPVGVDDLRKPPALVSWRPAFEDLVLESRDVIDAAILRAGVVFGGSGSLFGIWWEPLVVALKDNKHGEPVTILGNPDASLALIHKDDFAEATLNAVEKFESISQISYPVFDIVGGHETLGAINKAAAKALDITGEVKHEIPAPDNAFATAMSTSLLLDTTRSYTYLDWQPNHPSLVKYADIYAKAHLYSTDYYSTVTKSA
ncbi:hypothetical protein DRE_00360 [Drechslerella stenobrocha 248]|uniref:NAD(P)-binding domain-containing protein n=1 Tax=Drechslerella stenobrocha 248 TaxID=1043628 RepID=W7I4L2_9PEZI|nr:hypothetical protein DRE_00360 [Drechslerella stenobrocha 248]